MSSTSLCCQGAPQSFVKTVCRHRQRLKLSLASIFLVVPVLIALTQLHFSNNLFIIMCTCVVYHIVVVPQNSGFALSERRRGEATLCLLVLVVVCLICWCWCALFAGGGGVPYLLVLVCLITSHGGRTKQAVPLPLDSYITICLLQTPHEMICICPDNKPPSNIFLVTGQVSESSSQSPN